MLSLFIDTHLLFLHLRYASREQLSFAMSYISLITYTAIAFGYADY